MDRDRALDGVDHARELGEKVIASEVDDPPPMLHNERRHHLAVRGDGADGRRLVVRHQAAVALHVGIQEGGELPGAASGLHGSPLTREVSGHQPLEHAPSAVHGVGV